MKIISITVLILTLAIGFTSCGDSNKNKSGIIVEYPEYEDDLDDYEAFSLNSYQIPVMIYLPDESTGIGASTTPEVTHEVDGFEWEISIGQNFKLKIEDWGSDPFENFVNYVQKQSIYVVEVLEQTPDFIYYKTTLKSKGKEGVDNVGVTHEQYHVAAQHTINGYNYIFRTTEDGVNQKTAEIMAKSVRSVMPLDPAL